MQQLVYHFKPYQHHAIFFPHWFDGRAPFDLTFFFSHSFVRCQFFYLKPMKLICIFYSFLLFQFLIIRRKREGNWRLYLIWNILLGYREKMCVCVGPLFVAYITSNHKTRVSRRPISPTRNSTFHVSNLQVLQNLNHAKMENKNYRKVEASKTTFHHQILL